MGLQVAEADDALMRQALALAATAGDDVPVGAVVADSGGTIIGTGVNRREREGDPTAHAEVVALRQAATSLGAWNLSGCTLAVTLEPCLMCAGAILQARISRVVFGAWDEKAGAAGSVYDVLRDRRLPHQTEVLAGVRADQSTALLQSFFAPRRARSGVERSTDVNAGAPTLSSVDQSTDAENSTQLPGSPEPRSRAHST